LKQRSLLPIAAALLLTAAGPGSAQKPVDAPVALPVRDVTLFSSGVGYVERSGPIEGSATVTLAFPVETVPDILKSLVLLDDGGGRIRPVTYAARTPVTKALQAFAVDLGPNVTLANLLTRIRGTRVEVAAPTPITGSILSVETRAQTIKERTETVTLLNLLTDGGIRTVNMADVTNIRVLDERLDRELREALALLATQQDSQRRQIALHFDGAGKRNVRVGYLTEAPVWKMSYRLVLDEKKAPYLQAWAIVENPTEEDWNGVRLALVSGRPISFIQDLYQSLYIPRPVVAPEVVGSPYPQLHGADLDQKQAPAGMAGNGIGGLGGFGAAPPASDAATAAPGYAFGGGRAAKAKDERDREAALGALSEDSLRRAGATAEASGAARGELFEYRIDQPVSLPRQQSAMIPVAAHTIGGEKLSIYNPDVDARYPVNAVRLKNSTGLHLLGGPVTVFDGGIYAGDARMESVQPNEERLISYAVDLAVEGDRKQPEAGSSVTKLAIHHGVLTVSQQQRQVNAYTLRNKADKPRVVLVEQPYAADWKLAEPAAADERTDSLMRFRVTVPPGKSAPLKVATERTVEETLGLIDADLNLLLTHARGTHASPALAAALRQVAERRGRIADLQRQRAGYEAEIQAMDQEQNRIRQNMQQLDRQNALYQRYVAKLSEQETRIEKLRAEIQRVRGEEAEAQRSLQAYLDGLEVV
jgi:hypothetical protein